MVYKPKPIKLYGIRNVHDTKKLGKQLTFREIKELVNQFEDFDPRHILPDDRAQQYLDQNWEGRTLDFQHFGIKPRKKRKPPSQTESKK